MRGWNLSSIRVRQIPQSMISEVHASFYHALRYLCANPYYRRNSPRAKLSVDEKNIFRERLHCIAIHPFEL